MAGRLVAALDTDLSEVSLDTSGADTDARPLSDIVAEKFEGCDTFVSDPL